MKYPIFILTLIALLIFSFPIIAQNISHKEFKMFSSTKNDISK